MSQDIENFANNTVQSERLMVALAKAVKKVIADNRNGYLLCETVDGLFVASDAALDDELSALEAEYIEINDIVDKLINEFSKPGQGVAYE
jgi:hypothetical protein